MNIRHVLGCFIVAMLFTSTVFADTSVSMGNTPQEQAAPVEQFGAYSPVNFSSQIAVGSAVSTSMAAADPTEIAGPFVHTWSEYPSWSVFGVASEIKIRMVNGRPVLDRNGELIVDARPGYLGYVEKKWKADLVYSMKDYDPCILQYGAGQCDSTCLTNMDILAPSLGVKSVAIMPTSTSYGADAVIVRNHIKTLQDLKQVTSYMLHPSVSTFCWARNLEKRGENEYQYKVANLDPGECEKLMVQGSKDHQAICVWNPFKAVTLRGQPDCHVLADKSGPFDSSQIPGEIVDMVHMRADSLAKPGGDRAACAIIESYYLVSQLLADKSCQDEMLVALADRFFDVDPQIMGIAVRETRFYSTPEQGLSLYGGGVAFPWKKNVTNTSDLFTNNGFNPKSKEVTTDTFQDIMPRVVEFAKKYEILKGDVKLVYGSAKGKEYNVAFDPQYMKKVAERMKSGL